jgi:hypothetical protein
MALLLKAVLLNKLHSPQPLVDRVSESDLE